VGISWILKEGKPTVLLSVEGSKKAHVIAACKDKRYPYEFDGKGEDEDED